MARDNNGANLGFEKELWQAPLNVLEETLPDLISGELRVPGVERIVGRHG